MGRPVGSKNKILSKEEVIKYSGVIIEKSFKLFSKYIDDDKLTEEEKQDYNELLTLMYSVLKSKSIKKHFKNDKV
jgi:hypothetical protein